MSTIVLWLPYPATAKTFSGFGPHIDRYISEAAKHYQVRETMLRGLIKMEDGWYGKISPTGALGIGQFTVGTWNWLAQENRGRALGMTQVTPYNRGTRFDPRRNIRLNTLATALLARWHIEQFAERGIQASDENLYLAHNIGLDGLHRAIQGRSTISDIKNMRRNGMKWGMTVKEFMTYQKGRYLAHWRVANSMPSQPSSSSFAQSELSIAKNTQIVPEKQRRWVQPSYQLIRWIEPK